MDRLEEIVKKGSIRSLRELVYNSSKFHRIKHTRSFALLVDRLEQKDKEIDGLEGRNEMFRDTVNNQQKEIAQLKADNERLRKALEYFTNLTWQEAVEVFEEEE